MDTEIASELSVADEPPDTLVTEPPDRMRRAHPLYVATLLEREAGSALDEVKTHAERARVAAERGDAYGLGVETRRAEAAWARFRALRARAELMRQAWRETPPGRRQ